MSTSSSASSPFMIGKIYKMIHSQSDAVYVGSTFTTLRQRWYQHSRKVNSTSIGKLIREHGISIPSHFFSF